MVKIAGSGSESGSISQRQGYVDPDPHQNGMDPEHWSKHNKKFFLNVLIFLSDSSMVDLIIIHNITLENFDLRSPRARAETPRT